MEATRILVTQTYPINSRFMLFLDFQTRKRNLSIFKLDQLDQWQQEDSEFPTGQSLCQILQS